MPTGAGRARWSPRSWRRSAAEYEGKLTVYKVDTDKEQELAGAFGIQSIPSLLFIPMAGQPQMARGAMDRPAFDKAIAEILGVKKENRQIPTSLI